MRYKFLVFRDFGAGSREQGRGKSEEGNRKREEGKNNVYLMSAINAIFKRVKVAVPALFTT
ncbi:hypothetical protein BJP34_04670 [Moorena producens PAL-8-15-08-1]|uniref:Uncharacterized protein n=1 Tax=Moorena producens PAL-8-15-08-1 TaxID=1458985 RepID=A0A1D8TMF2_9CYAN|nr:hypothetical protein BJP34_04670 [Moorena producens PAL-8-15-08-1]